MTYLDWAGSLPESWEVKSLGTVAEYAVSNVDKIPADNEIPVRLCNYSDVYNNEVIDLSLEFMRTTATEHEIARFGLQEGDVIITKDSESWDDIGVPAYVRERADDLVCGYHLVLIRPRSCDLLGAFLSRCLQARPISAQLESSARGVTRFGLAKSDIASTKLPIPPLAVQERIADYLEYETVRIDELVAVKERLVGLLKEKRRAFVAHAVTRGVNPTVRLCISDIPWLDRMPAHWTTERARWLFSERDLRSEFGIEELLTVSHISGVTPRANKDVTMFEAESNVGYKICLKGDLVINTLWAWMGAMGIAPMCGIVSPAYNVYVPTTRLEPDYVDALVRIDIFAQEVTRYSKGIWHSRLSLYPEYFFELMLPVPPRCEQKEIIRSINRTTMELDESIESAQRSISLLKERRAALIAEAVTGQIDMGVTK